MAELFSITTIDHRTLVLLDDITVSEEEEYINGSDYSFEFSGQENYVDQYSTPVHYDFISEWINTSNGLPPDPDENIRHALYIDYTDDPDPIAPILRFYNPNTRNAIYYTRTGTNQDNIPGDFTFSTSYAPEMYAEVAINIPVFETLEEAEDYVLADNEHDRIVALKKAYNYHYPAEKEGEEFEITNIWTHGTWTQYGHTVGGGAIYHHDVRGKINENGRLSFYKIDGITDGALKYGVDKSAEFIGVQYSLDGVTWIDADDFPFNFMYRERIDELGTFDYALVFSDMRFPIWNNHEDSLDYIRGDKDIEEAPNWPQISGDYTPINKTGESDDETEFGEVYTRSFFTNQYICSEGAIQEICNALYDTTPGGIWEDIKKGLDMFGQNPMDAVVNLMYFPVNLNNVFTNTSLDHSIWFGGYQFNLTSNTVNKIIYPNGYFNIGSTKIERTFNNWRDLPPYTKLFVDLPYCGRYELDPTIYYGKILNVRYYIDTHTGGCVACLISGGHCYDQFNGQIGTQIPITLTDFSAYANAQINTLLGSGGQAVNTGLSLGSTAAGAVAGGSAALSLASAGATAGALGALQGAKTVYGLTQNNINKFNKTRGGSSGMLNQYLNQKVTFTFETMLSDIPDNFYQLKGGPSNYGGRVGDFGGYFEAEQVKLNVQGATENEKEKIRTLLMGGIYI